MRKGLSRGLDEKVKFPIMDSESESDTDSQMSSFDELLSETEALLATVAMLQEEAARRTEALRVVGSYDWITECHEASMIELERTGEVTFGQHLLRRLGAKKHN